MSDKPDIKQKEVILESWEVAPFRNSSDWHGTEGEVVVTFETMKGSLWRSWKSQCVENKSYDKEGKEIKPKDFEDPQEYFDIEPERSERTVEPDNFDYSRTKKPGIYRDGKYYDDENSVDEGYTIIVPYANLNPKICSDYIEKLNRKFDRNFKLKVDNQQKYPVADLKRMKAILAKKDMDKETKDSLLKLIRDLSEDINDN